MWNTTDETTEVMWNTSNETDVGTAGLSSVEPITSSAKLSPASYTTIGVYLLLIGTTATVGNITVILVILKDRKLRKNGHNQLLLNLAVSDLGISIFGYPPSTISGFAGRWVFGNTGCQIIGFMCTLLALTDINTLMALSVYRYIIICKPHLKHVVESRRVGVSVVGSTWLYSLAWSVAALLGWNRYELEPFGTSCSIDWDGRSAGDISYTVIMIITCYLTHIAVMVYCYVHVHRVSRRTSERLHGKATFCPDDAVMDNRLQGERKVTWMSVVMVTSFTVIWSPYAWAAVWAVVDPPIPAWVNTFPTMFAKSSCMVNPIIYVITNPKFRESARKLWRKRPTAVNDITMAAVKARRGNTRMYTIDSTKEGIYIGKRHIEVERHEPVF